ncbi:MAG: glycine zipper 2TM domain-containing protein [Sedimentisphaerales bacterium]|nr:glycine zipper 2TM domain-containing protein [Sedimentisphaerales bacterium]
MNRNSITILVATFICAALMVTAGCESDAQTGAGIGAAAGAGIGQLAGRDTESTLIGGAVGGGVGYIVGNEQDKKKAKAGDEQLSEEMNTVTVNVTNSNGSIIPVKLKKQGVGFFGPRGEYYDHLPTSEELRPVYGF